MSESEATTPSELSSCNLWISGLTHRTTAIELENLLTKYGHVNQIKIIKDNRDKGVRHYGYAVMSSTDEATNCAEKLNGMTLHRRTISVKFSKPIQPNRGGECTNETDKNDDVPSNDDGVLTHTPETIQPQRSKTPKLTKKQLEEKSKEQSIVQSKDNFSDIAFG